MRNLSLELLEDMFQSETVFADMGMTVEDSPYHREANVLVHTRMVMDWYKASLPASVDDYLLGLFACALHDIAKPRCRVEKINEKRGTYYSYDRHDVVGAEMAEEMMVRCDVSEFDIYRISWMIRHHQIFWATKKRDIRNEMARVLVDHNFYLPFKYMMIADDMGRITDARSVDSKEYFRQFEMEQLIA